MPTRSNGNKLKILAAFAAVYFFWGSTYLAIRLAIETLPPFLMAAMRFLAAGAILYVWARRNGAPRPTRVHWRTAFIAGGLLLVMGNGVIVWAEQFVPSGLAALLMATVPLWVVVITSAANVCWPTWTVLGGVVLGFVGITLLVNPNTIVGGDHFSPLPVMLIVLAAFSWAFGTYYSGRAPQPASPLMSTALNLIAGGTLLTILAGLSGEFPRLDLSTVSPTSWLALAYLIIFGSLVGFNAYLWLVKVTTPALASSTGYVNPVVAIFMGWAIAGEAITPRVLMAMLIIVGAVVLIAFEQKRGTERRKNTGNVAGVGQGFASKRAG